MRRCVVRGATAHGPYCAYTLRHAQASSRGFTNAPTEKRPVQYLRGKINLFLALGCPLRGRPPCPLRGRRVCRCCEGELLERCGERGAWIYGVGGRQSDPKVHRRRPVAATRHMTAARRLGMAGHMGGGGGRERPVRVGALWSCCLGRPARAVRSGLRLRLWVAVCRRRR